MFKKVILAVCLAASLINIADAKGLSGIADKTSALNRYSSHYRILSPRSPQEAAKAFEKYFNAGDLEGMLSLHDKNIAFIPSPGTQLNQPDQIRQALKQFLSLKLPIDMKVRHIYQADDIALIIFDWSIQGVDPAGKQVNLKGTGADIVRKQMDGSWLYLFDNPFGTTSSNTQ